MVRAQRNRLSKHAQKQRELIKDGQVLRRTSGVREAYSKGYVIFRRLFDWTDEGHLHTIVRRLECCNDMVDEDAQKLEESCDKFAEGNIFNDSVGDRKQHPFDPDNVPSDDLKQKFQRLKLFLSTAFIHHEMSDWTILEFECRQSVIST